MNYKLRTRIARTKCYIDLNGDITNEEGMVLKSDYSQQGRRNTRVYYKPRITRKLVMTNARGYNRNRKGWHKVSRKYRVYSNARLMVESFFSLDFPYKIVYKDNDRSNTRLDNIILKDTIKRYETADYKWTYVDLSEYYYLIEKHYRNEDELFEKVQLSLRY